MSSFGGSSPSESVKAAPIHNETRSLSGVSQNSDSVVPTSIQGQLPMPAPASGMQTGAAIEAALLASAKMRADRPADQTFFLGLIAGIWVGFGGIAGYSAACGVSETVRQSWPIVPKFLTGAFFAFALHFIVIMGGELFTGTTLVFSIGWYNRAISVHRSIINLTLIYIGNWCGCLLVSYFLAYLSGLFADASSRQWMDTVVVGKTLGHGWGVLFLRAIGANVMVCIAISMFTACTDSAGKIMSLWIPVVVFVISGFEHCVANMFFLSTGLLYGAPSTIGRMWFNQSAAVVGNFFGGAIVVGLSMHLMNNWISPIPWNGTPANKARNDADAERMGAARSS
ncbi:hypothetical protein BDV93DRAFT_447734 [Ceratobasidium sp. AG-I]|nr:hypothetical protein BDV93DRAFT_447734 [Ceratobasidium sp. AG-I]